MKNKREDWCYVCGELVPEETGIAEQKPRQPGDPGWGGTRWVVRHTTCPPCEKGVETTNNNNQEIHGN
jgi:hypothetical protein